jgi:hypothetical protein
MIRSPYGRDSAKRWVEFAKYQQNNMRRLHRKLLVRYEDLTDDINGTIKRILRFIPQIGSLNVEHVPDGLDDHRRRGPIKNMNHNHSTDSLAAINQYLMGYEDLVRYFGYEIR